MSSNSQSPGGDASEIRGAQDPPPSSPSAAVLASSPARSHNDDAVVGSPPTDGAQGSPCAVDDVRSSPSGRHVSDQPSAGGGDGGDGDDGDAMGSPARSLPPTPMTDFSPPRSFSGSIPRTPSSMGRSLPGTPRTPFTPMDMQVGLKFSRAAAAVVASGDSRVCIGGRLAASCKGRLFFAFLLVCVCSLLCYLKKLFRCLVHVSFLHPPLLLLYCCVSLAEQQTGRSPDIYHWRENYETASGLLVPASVHQQ